MVSERIPMLQGWRWIAALALAYATLAEAALLLSRSTAGIAYVWPASGVAAAAMLVMVPRGRAAFLALVWSISVVINARHGTPWTNAMGFGLANCLEAVVVCRIGRSGDGGILAFDAPRQVARFVLGAVIAAALSAAVATPFAQHGASLAFYSSWAVTVGLGILIVTPTILTLTRDVTNASPSDRRTARAIAMGVAVLCVSLITFLQNHYPLLFLPVIMVTLSTYVLGSTGAAWSIVIVAMVGTLAGSTGHGPVMLVDAGHQQIAFFQFYLLCLIASAMPLATLRAVAQRKDRQIAESMHHLEAAEHIAHLGNWYLDLSGDLIRWSPEMFRIYGIPEKPFATRSDSVDGFHPDDRPQIAAILERSVKEQKKFDFSGRIVRPDGTVRHVQGRGDVIADAGMSRALFGILHDVTDRVLLLNEVRAARIAAERQALVMEHLANTDPLTGLANRRRAMAELERQIGIAHRDHSALAVIMLDVDHFKAINDRYGHDMGDRVLDALAVGLPSCLGQGDCLARIGGEEFLGILPGRSSAEAVAVAEAMRLAAADLHQTVGTIPAISVSLGVAMLEPGRRRDALLKAADLALFQAKAAGRNRSALAA